MSIYAKCGTLSEVINVIYFRKNLTLKIILPFHESYKLSFRIGKDLVINAKQVQQLTIKSVEEEKDNYYLKVKMNNNL